MDLVASAYIERGLVVGRMKRALRIELDVAFQLAGEMLDPGSLAMLTTGPLLSRAIYTGIGVTCRGCEVAGVARLGVSAPGLADRRQRDMRKRQ